MDLMKKRKKTREILAHLREQGGGVAEAPGDINDMFPMEQEGEVDMQPKTIADPAERQLISLLRGRKPRDQP